MASILKVDSIGKTSGSTQDTMKGLVKVWFAVNGTGTPANRDSFNISTVTDNTTGDMTQNFLASMNNATYATSAMAGGKSGSYAENINHYYEDDPCTSSSIRLAIDYNNSLADGERSSGQISGDLA
tara:strand:+ start:339 stop:716 length:378 start_codon:yes stop_codon:yes gene_type:complete